MHRAHRAWIAALVVPALLGCGSETATSADTAAPSESTSPAPPTGDTLQDRADGTVERSTTTSVDLDDHPGPNLLVTVDAGDLVALEVATGDVVVLARRAELADALGLPDGRFDDVDLSPDGATVAFAFGGWAGDRGAHGLFEVPVDGSAGPRRVPTAVDDVYVARPRYSPDGRMLAAVIADRLVVLDEDRTPTGDGIQMPYAPRHLTWAPDGASLLWLGHFERNDCCTRLSAAVDPATGRMADQPTREQTTGSPYFDAAGDLRTMPTQFSFDVDQSRRFVIASDGTPGQLLWWEVTSGDPVPRPLSVDLDLAEAPPLSW